MQAMKTLFYVPRFRGQTILHPLKAKYGRVLLSAWPKSSHGGMKANKLMSSICKLAGIVNIGIKVGLCCHERDLLIFCRPAHVGLPLQKCFCHGQGKVHDDMREAGLGDSPVVLEMVLLFPI